MTPPEREFDDLSIDQFEAELRRFSQSRPVTPVADPLDRAVQLIEQNPAQSRSRLLARLLSALSGQQARFRYAEVGSLDSAVISLVIQLMATRRSGAVVQDEWLRAAAKANACQDVS